MQVTENDKILCNDKWLSALVDAMDEVESLRADDICRGSFVPAGLMVQLRGRNVIAGRSHRPANTHIQLA
jgi:hypothetical protein